MNRSTHHAIIVLLLLLATSCMLPAQIPLTGFSISPHWNEQILTFPFNGDVRIVVNAPAPERLDPSRPTRLILFALPNGNTIEQTTGKQLREGDDWHFDIQHIGAQARRLRELVPQENFIVAYLEASSKSWPAWRRTHDNASALLLRIVDTLRLLTATLHPTVTLTGHSGGGSFTFGVLNALDAIPGWIDRIVFLDSNYSFDDSLGHGTKLLSWLQADPHRQLGVVAYDDRWITLNGKRVVGPDGGTLRATGRMTASLGKAVPFTESADSVFNIFRALNGRIDFRVHRNPDTLILHTVLVARNGFLHAMLLGTPAFPVSDPLWGEVRYRPWIQP